MNPAFGKWMNVIVNSVLNLVLVSISLVYFHNFSVIGLATGWVCGMGIGYMIGDLIPGVAIGNKFADSLGIRQMFVKHLISTAVLALILITIVSFLCQFSTFGKDIFAVWPVLLPRLLLGGYVALLITLPIAQKLAAKLSGIQV